ncbi:maleylpyruvate isomerase family mycothiol-dependent enzyme [Nocardioides panacisoli]
MDVVSRTAANRRLLADFFDGLEEDQLDARSLCDAWSVREVLGHLVMPVTVGLGGFVVQIVRARGSIDRASEALAARLAERPVAELTGLLREHADLKVPRPMGQLADTCLHLRDCARPLGLATDADLADWRAVLDWFTASRASGFVDRRTLPGLALRATDQDWSWGDGTEVAGPSEALAMTVSGRTAALDDLTGPGVVVLRERITR